MLSTSLHTGLLQLQFHVNAITHRLPTIPKLPKSNIVDTGVYLINTEL